MNRRYKSIRRFYVKLTTMFRQEGHDLDLYLSPKFFPFFHEWEKLCTKEQEIQHNIDMNKDMDMTLDKVAACFFSKISIFKRALAANFLIPLLGLKINI